MAGFRGRSRFRRRSNRQSSPNSVRAELVEAPFFVLSSVQRARRPFDKLRANGDVSRSNLPHRNLDSTDAVDWRLSQSIAKKQSFRIRQLRGHSRRSRGEDMAKTNFNRHSGRMDESPTLVLLPGLDGTCILLAEFSEALSVISRVETIEYPIDEILSYDQLANYVKSRLPHGDFILIGESFSGPLALMIASEKTKGLKGVVLGASFARLDLPLKALISAAANFSPKLIPMFALSFLLLGKWTNPNTIQMLRSALSMVTPEVLSGRAKEALAVDISAQCDKIEYPTLLLQAQQDRLIPKAGAAAVAEVCDRLSVVEIEGPHFLFQTKSSECVSAIRKFFDSVVQRDNDR
jgi:pimeloyl-[acyl-carrier protein] methyl ester esterase